MDSGVLKCTGRPVSVLRTKEQFRNVEIVVEWMHEKAAGNSGLFVWVTPASIEKLTAAGKTDWFGTNGDVFEGGKKFQLFPSVLLNCDRSFPTRRLSNRYGEWNHYYV